MKNYVTKKFESKKKVDSEIEILKKQRAVTIENTYKEFDDKIKSNLDDIESQIKYHKDQIESLEKSKETSTKVIYMKRDVELNKKVSKIDRKIVCKQNISRSLSHYIDAENKSIQDTIDFANINNTPEMPDTPTYEYNERFKKILLEDKE